MQLLPSRLLLPRWPTLTTKIRIAPFDIEEPAATIGAGAGFSYYGIFGRVRAHSDLLPVEATLPRPVEETDLLMSLPTMVVLSGSRMEEAPR